MILVNGGLTVETFSKDIEDLVEEYDMDYLEAAVYYCEKNNIEIETAASIIKQNLNIQAKVQFEAESLNYLPKSARLIF